MNRFATVKNDSICLYTITNRTIGLGSNISSFQQGESIIFMFFPDLLKFLSHLGVRKDNVAIISQAERVQGGVGGAACAELGLSPGCFTVTCKNASMYGKKMRDLHMAGFCMQSDTVIRFRSSDGKVAVADLLVGVGKYGKFGHAQEAIYKLIENCDDKVSDLESLEDDKELDQKVCTFFKIIQIPDTKFQIVDLILVLNSKSWNRSWY